jgi:lipid A 4'-phosphatase
MPTDTHPNLPHNATPKLFWWILCASIVLALLPTAWISLDLKTASLFLGPQAYTGVTQWWWVELINLYVPAVFRVFVLVALVGWIWTSLQSWGKRWRLPLAFVVIAGALGPGLVVNSGFKENWQRSRPYQVQAFGGTQQFTRAAVITDQCDNNCSFVSGHVACGIFLASLLLVDRKRRVMWGTAGTMAGLLIGFARIADGAHWLSDVFWASPITLVTSWLVWKALLRVYPEKSGD